MGSVGGHLVRRHIHPLDGCAAGHAPDRSGFGHLLSDLIRSVDGGAVVCPILVKVAEGGGLDCEHHVLCFVPLIIQARTRRMQSMMDGFQTVPDSYRKTGKCGKVADAIVIT